MKATQQTVNWLSRQTAGRLAPLGNGWKREHESKFLDSDWPSFKNTFHSLSLSLSILSFFTKTTEQPNKSRKVNIKVFALKGQWIPHRTADLCAAGR